MTLRYSRPAPDQISERRRGRFNPIPLLLSFTFFFLIAFLLPRTLSAQLFFEPSSIGMDRAEAISITRSEGGDLLIGTRYGIYRMEAGSDRWDWYQFYTWANAIERGPSGTIVSGSFIGIHRSTDDGESWKGIYNVSNLGDFAFIGDSIMIAIDAGQTGVDSGTVPDGFYYRSTDDGKSWQEIEYTFGYFFWSQVAAVDTFFFHTSILGVMVANASDTVWSPTGLNLQTMAEKTHPSSLIATTDGILVAILEHRGTPERVIVESRDTGKSWIPVDSGTWFRRLIADAHGGYAILVDRPTQWPPVPDTIEGVWRRRPGVPGRSRMITGDTVQAIYFEGDDIWMGANDHMYHRKEGEISWSDISRGLQNLGVTRLTTGTDGSLYALAFDRFLTKDSIYQNRPAVFSLYRSVDTGASWQFLSGGLSNAALAFDRFGNIYAQVDSLEVVTDSKSVSRLTPTSYIVVSNDGGRNWHVIREGSIYQLSPIAPEGTSTVAFTYTLPSSGGELCRDMMISHDSGRTWVSMTDPGMPWNDTTLALLPSAPASLPTGDLMFGSTIDNTATPTDDRGIYLLHPDNTLELINDRMMARAVLDVAADGTIRLSGSNFFRNRGFYRSTDNGLTWNVYDETGEPEKIVHLDNGWVAGYPEIGPTLLSSDNGTTWQILDRAYDWVVAASNGEFYGMSNGDLYITTTDGHVTHYFVSQLPGFPGELTGMVAVANYLFAESSCYGLYRSVVPQNAGVDDERERNGSELSAIDLSMRQQGSELVVTTSDRLDTPIRIELFDLLGRPLLQTDERGERTESLNLSLRGIPAGTYILRLTAGRQEITRVVQLQ